MEYQLEENNIHTKELYWRYFRKGFRGIKRATWFVTARDDDKLVGCMGVLEKEAGQFNFLHLVVHPDYRRKGIGTTIIKKAVKFLRKRGAWLIRNHKSSNVMPHDIFTDMGFEVERVENKTKVYELYMEQTIEDI